MKKGIGLFCVAFVLSIWLCGCQKAGAGIADASSSPSESAAQQNNAENADTRFASTEGSSDTNDTEESLTEKLTREIDGAYTEELKLPEFGTTVGMIELADRYTAKWKQVAEEYYDKIMAYDGIVKQNDDDYSSDDLHTFVSNMKANWEQYYQTQSDNYAKTLKALYDGGTIGGPIFANYQYEMQKEWALQLVGIYQQLYIQ